LVCLGERFLPYQVHDALVEGLREHLPIAWPLGRGGCGDTGSVDLEKLCGSGLDTSTPALKRHMSENSEMPSVVLNGTLKIHSARKPVMDSF
jgi:hypothetical protein